MKSRLLKNLSTVALVISIPIAANASLIGTTVRGCSTSGDIICVPGSGHSWFDNDTAVVVDPGVEFSGSLDTTRTGFTYSANFGVRPPFNPDRPVPTAGLDAVTITLTYSTADTYYFRFYRQNFAFTDLYWDDGRIITGLTILGEWPLKSMSFGPHSIEFLTHDVPNQSGSHRLTATIAIETSPVPIPPALVTIDIKPGSDPNCFNINGHGVIPVAILGTADFDVTEIDQASLLFGGLEVRVRGNKGPLCSLDHSNEDAYFDLICHFEDDDPSAWETGDGEATLTGKLLEEWGGTPIEGKDSICVVP